MSDMAAVNEFAQPKKVTDADVVFGGIDGLMPDYKTIPDEFKAGRGPWVKWQQDWFYSGLKDVPVAKEGVVQRDAMRHLKAIQGSFEPSHEHKEAAVAYLASLWLVMP
jgi:hypothetical protein